MIASAKHVVSKQCPRCKADVYYKYGRNGNGKQKYICRICGRQFVSTSQPICNEDRPYCFRCSSRMHIYMKNGSFLIFRCSGYPVCKTYIKKKRGGE
ncbi:MAG: Insertion element protein [Nitrospirae bacterium]|nr:MAG: Insertion element protein [Nitrospirota bacterium]